jgi:hypothetical protein
VEEDGGGQTEEIDQTDAEREREREREREKEREEDGKTMLRCRDVETISSRI